MDELHPFLPRILAADGSPADIHLLGEAFKDSGFPMAIEGALTGADAISRIERRGRHAACAETIDLVLIDLHLPRPAGKQVLTWIKGQPRYRDLVVIVHSADLSPAECGECLALGANGCFVKPVRFEEYPPFIEQLVGKLVERRDDSSCFV
jgi:CheY-like chemotaxis protein